MILIWNDYSYSWIKCAMFLIGSFSVVKNLPAKAGDKRDVGSVPGSGRSPGEGHGNPLQYSCLENPMDKGAWRAIVHRVTQSQTWLTQLSTHAELKNFHMQLLEFQWLLESILDHTAVQKALSKSSSANQVCLKQCWIFSLLNVMRKYQ